MADYSELKAAIRAAIYDNVSQAITGDKLQEILLEMVDELGAWTTDIPGAIEPGISLARYISTELTETGIYTIQDWRGKLSDGDIEYTMSSVIAVVLKSDAYGTFRLAMVDGIKMYQVRKNGDVYTLDRIVTLSWLNSVAENWTFTLADGTTVTKKIIVLP